MRTLICEGGVEALMLEGIAVSGYIVKVKSGWTASDADSRYIGRANTRDEAISLVRSLTLTQSQVIHRLAEAVHGILNGEHPDRAFMTRGLDPRLLEAMRHGLEYVNDLKEWANEVLKEESDDAEVCDS